MLWIGIKRKGIDKKGSSSCAKRNFNPCDSIGTLFGAIFDREVTETHDEGMGFFKEFVFNMPGDNMGSTSDVGMQYVNDIYQINGSSKKNFKTQLRVYRMP